MSNLQKFLESVCKGLEDSKNREILVKINENMNARIEAKIREIASELSGLFIEKIADELQERGLALDGHKIITGFSSKCEDYKERELR